MLQTQLPISFMLVKIMQRVWIFPCIQNKFIHTCKLPVGNKQTILCGGAWGHLSSFGTRVHTCIVNPKQFPSRFIH